MIGCPYTDALELNMTLHLGMSVNTLPNKVKVLTTLL
jgi:hypothetical protein